MVEEWLSKYAVGYSKLSKEEKETITNFPLLWSLFEAQILNCSASASSIKSKINDWDARGLLKLDGFKKYKEYFTHRYVNENNMNHKFSQLHLRKNDYPSLVEQVLKDETNLTSEIVTALLVIVLRYRNNFFHGSKWAYEFEKQFDNFSMANELLMYILEIHWQMNNGI